MYQNLVVGNIPGAQESVHLMRLPRAATRRSIDPELEDDDGGGHATSVQLGRACRNAANIKVRQPARARCTSRARS